MTQVSVAKGVGKVRSSSESTVILKKCQRKRLLYQKHLDHSEVIGSYEELDVDAWWGKQKAYLYIKHIHFTDFG